MVAAGKSLPHFPLVLSLRATAKTEEHGVESQNVVTLRPGTDPALKGEYVVLSAHPDHLGVGDQYSFIRRGVQDWASLMAAMVGPHESNRFTVEFLLPPDVQAAAFATNHGFGTPCSLAPSLLFIGQEGACSASTIQFAFSEPFEAKRLDIEGNKIGFHHRSPGELRCSVVGWLCAGTACRGIPSSARPSR